VSGPEDVEVTSSGGIYAGTLDGRVVLIEPRGSDDQQPVRKNV